MENTIIESPVKEHMSGEKGTLVDGYGKESDEHTTIFMQQVEGIHK